jgi:two-component system cell cycle sensor histidine kinase/response regulator CckA
VVAGPRAADSWEGPIRLLIVDDEPALLGLLQRYLERLGYAVEVAGNAQAALAKFESDPGKYACVLTDLKLPGMSGEEMLKQMRALRPGLLALVSSGLPYVPQSAGVGFLQKPYLPAMLAEALERLLKGGSKA